MPVSVMIRILIFLQTVALVESVENYVNIGCVYHTEDGASSLTLAADENTIPRCSDHCKQTYHTYFVLQDYQQGSNRSCTCVSHLDLDLSSGKCDVLCGTYVCGSTTYSTLYASAYAVCDPGFYGLNCELRCHCAQNAICGRSSTGRCPAGCEPGWKGDRCDQPVNGSGSGQTTVNVPSTIGPPSSWTVTPHARKTTENGLSSTTYGEPTLEKGPMQVNSNLILITVVPAVALVVVAILVVAIVVACVCQQRKKAHRAKAVRYSDQDQSTTVGQANVISYTGYLTTNDIQGTGSHPAAADDTYIEILD